MMSRREFLLGATAVGTVAAAGGVASVASSKDAQESDAVQHAWRNAAGIDRILLAATFAANSHNTQPWRFRVGDGVIDVLADSERGMGAADPRTRELYMSLGCAVENAVIAAADLGTPVNVEYALGGDRLPFTRLRLANRKAEARDHADLAAAIVKRRTNRAPYDTERQVPIVTLGSLSALASAGVGTTWLTTQAERERFSQLSFVATQDYVADKTIQRDSHRWYRLRGDDAERTREGITVRGANLPPIGALLLGLFPPTPDDFDTEWAKTTRESQCGTASAVGLLTVGGSGERTDWIDAGRTYQRMQLAAAAAGVVFQPISQALTLRDRETVTGAAGKYSAALGGFGGVGEVVLAFRVGYPTREQAVSLRRAPVVART
jgi:hypothetical protein